MSKIPQAQTEKRMKVQLALIDYDVLRYELGAVQLDHPMKPGLKVPAPSSFVEKLVDNRINEIMEATGADDFMLCITGDGNFRFDIAKQAPYKGNREGFEKPYHWRTVDKIGRDKYGVHEVVGTEADDFLAITQRNYLNAGVLTAICSRDKDLRMCEGWHYSWACGSTQREKPLRYISFLDGKKFFFRQLLTGDPVDNILGCGFREESIYKSGKKVGQKYFRRKGIGPKHADKMLAQGETVSEWYEIVRNAYLEIFGAKADEVMLENARLLYIGQKGKDNMFEWSWLNVKTGQETTDDTSIREDSIRSSEERQDSGMESMDRGCEDHCGVRPEGRENAASGDDCETQECRSEQRDDCGGASETGSSEQVEQAVGQMLQGE